MTFILDCGIAQGDRKTFARWKIKSLNGGKERRELLDS
jgi:hypothetical protein